jgi:hypothetical protein
MRPEAYTDHQGDSIRFIFQGNGIYFIGTTGPNNGNYTVQYDNGQVEMFTGYSENRRSRQMLYSRGNAGSGNHEVVCTQLWPWCRTSKTGRKEEAESARARAKD